MMRSVRLAVVISAVLAFAMACTSSGPTTPRSSGSGARPGAPTTQVKRITAAMMGEPSAFIARMNGTQITIPGINNLEQLVNASLSELNAESRLQPQLAEAVPSLENGLWQVFPDGRMQTTWKIRQGARWHDGTPFTASDVVFASTVDQDREIPVLKPVGYGWVEKIEALDAGTVQVTWNRPYIDADTMFTLAFTSPIPRHLLEETYSSDKQRFMTMPFWSQEFVGSGPFKVRQFVPGNTILLEANENYVLGKPKIDEIQLRFILDPNTLVTNILAGETELSIGRGFTTEQAMELKDRWHEGRMVTFLKSWVAIHPQFNNPSSPVIQDLQFRQALYHAVDRQQLVDTLQRGLTQVAHVYVSPAAPEYKESADSVVTYAYDPRRSAELLEGLGYARGADGAYHQPTGERLAVELRSNGERITENAIVPVADFWTRIGVPTEPLLVPPQRIIDREYVATFPNFRMMRQPDRGSQLSRVHSSFTPLSTNAFVGSNYSRYVNPEFDGLIDSYLSTIPWQERMAIFRQAMRHISERLNLMGLFYDPDFAAASNRIKNLGINDTELWDAHLWDLSS